MFADRARADARPVIERLKSLGYGVELVSGDRPPAVEAVAASVGIDTGAPAGDRWRKWRV